MSHDALTALADRRQVIAQLESEVERCHRDRRDLAIVVLSLDHWHEMVDALGHSAADRVLGSVADRLRQALRPDEIFGRTGNDEFVMAFAAYEASAEASGEVLQRAQQLLERVDACLQAGDPQGRACAAAGLALYPADADNALELLRCGEIGMLHARKNNSHRLERYHADLDTGRRTKFDLEGQLRTALSTRDMRVFYQPVVDLRTGRIASAEALIRLPASHLTMANTVAVIALAQESGLIGAVDTHALTVAGTQAKAWQGKPGAPARISVNVSTNQFQDENYVALVERTLRQTGTDPRYLELEVTEHALMAQPAESTAKLTALRRLGLSIALDDFGTGYSSLTFLRRLPIDRIKIDAQFVYELERDPEAASVVEAIILMGKALGFQIVAEAIETAGQLQFVKQHGCHYGQGYLFSRPVPAGEIEELMLRDSLLPA